MVISWSGAGMIDDGQIRMLFGRYRGTGMLLFSRDPLAHLVLIYLMEYVQICHTLLSAVFEPFPVVFFNNIPLLLSYLTGTC